MKLLGSILVILACGYVGFSQAAGILAEERQLQQLILALEFMEKELNFRMPPLQELCSAACDSCTGPIQNVLRSMGQALSLQAQPDAALCMAEASEAHRLAGSTKRNLKLLGISLGRFDLQGQLSGLDAVQQLVRRDLRDLQEGKHERIRSCRTLALCAGAALVILLI